jgi:hypothetical protein
MMAKHIAGAVANPGAPEGWKPEDGTCGHLPIRIFARNDGTIMWCESAWEPTPQEIEWLARGGQIVLRVIGWQVPVALYVEPPPKEPKD